MAVKTHTRHPEPAPAAGALHPAEIALLESVGDGGTFTTSPSHEAALDALKRRGYVSMLVTASGRSLYELTETGRAAIDAS